MKWSRFFGFAFYAPQPSGKDEQKLQEIIRQKHIPGTKAARADMRRMAKTKSRRRP